MRSFCIVLCVIGMFLSVLLLQMHAGSTTGDGFVARTCKAVGGCDQVLRSKWAWFPPTEVAEELNEVGADKPFRVPIALLGLQYFAALLIWFLMIGRGRAKVNIGLVVVLGLGCLGSVSFLYLMNSVIKAACPFCLMTHAVNFLLFGFAVAYLIKERGEVIDIGRQLYGATAMTIVSILAALGFGWKAGALISENGVLKETLSSIRNDISTVEMVWRAKDPVEIKIRDNIAEYQLVEFDPIVNALPGFRNTLVVFADAECEACRRFHEFLFGQIRPLFSGHLRIVWKHYPLEGIHPNAWDAARALEAARLQNKFWSYLDLLHENQSELAKVDYRELAVECGMDPAQFERDRTGREVDERIRADVAEAGRLELDATPAVFLNSRRVDGSIRNLPGFWKLQASRLKELRMQKKQGWGSSAGLASGGGAEGSKP